MPQHRHARHRDLADAELEVLPRDTELLRGGLVAHVEPGHTQRAADAQILHGLTAYQTDAGACADYDSVIGMEKTEPLQRFTRKLSTGRMTPAQGPATVCGVFVETDDNTGLSRRIEPVRLGGRLKPAMPE